MRTWKQYLRRASVLCAAMFLLALWTVRTTGSDGGAALFTGGTAELTQEEDAPLIALTFDDGPSSATTATLLDGLAQRGIHATFFLVGSMAADNHDLVRRMANEGHQIGLHTYDHSSSQGLAGLNHAQFRAQVDTTRDLLTALTGQTKFALRPPYGFVDGSVQHWAQAPIILWSVDPEDWRDRDARRVVAHILSHAQDGSIVLLHDIFPQSVDAALKAADALMEQGYRLVTIDELFAARGLTPVDGTVYRSLDP